jgi:dCTP deaminase
MERVTGIEPALSAWEADVLPLNYTRERADDPTRTRR